MPEIKMTSEILNDKYTEYVYNKFDIQDREKTEVTVSFDFSPIKGQEWNIGVVYGGSGSGKTSILKQLGNLASCNFDPDKSLVSNFDWLEPDEATRLLSAMGLSSVPTWLRPFRLLSNGEQYRAELAYKVGKAKAGELILIDEYTSVVDRDVAKAMSFALQKYIRKHDKKIILASCHYDIMEWLMPDWTLSPQKGGVLERGEWLRRGKPAIDLQVSRTEHGAWDFFKDHHYLTQKVNKSCKFFLYEWNGKPVGIVCAIPQPGAGARKTAMALSRTVVLPDFQGLGIGPKIAEFTAAILKADGGRKVYTKTISPALGHYRNKHTDKYRPTARNGKSTPITDKLTQNRMSRASFCHEYIGPGIEGYEDLLHPIAEMRKRKKDTNGS